MDPEALSTEDAEISPDLLEALASQKLTPDQIEVVSDSSGRTRIQSRSELQGAMGGVEEGHLYIAPGKSEFIVDPSPYRRRSLRRLGDVKLHQTTNLLSFVNCHLSLCQDERWGQQR